MELNRSLKNTFGKVSNLYDSARASYPDELIDELIKISKINNKSKILEIGCGSGKATILFAKRGYDVLGVDISEELIDLAKKNSSQFENVSYFVSSFEDIDLESNGFDLIFSAQAWHWLDPEIAYKKAWKLLKKEGFLSIFWKHGGYDESDFLKKLRELYIKYCPNYHFPTEVSSAEKELLKSSLFNQFEKREYFAELKYDKEKFIQLVSTMSWVISIPKENESKFFSELSNLLDQQDEIFSVPYKYTLLIARKISK